MEKNKESDGNNNGNNNDNSNALNKKSNSGTYHSRRSVRIKSYNKKRELALAVVSSFCLTFD